MADSNIDRARPGIAALRQRAESWFYRFAPLFVISLIDDPAMLALAFC